MFDVTRVTDESGQGQTKDGPRLSNRSELCNTFERRGRGRRALSVRGKGFADVQRDWNAGNGISARLEITLFPFGVNQQVLVTATRKQLRLSEVAVGAVAHDQQDLRATPALLADDKRRQKKLPCEGGVCLRSLKRSCGGTSKAG
jgi:hypothetical protein